MCTVFFLKIDQKLLYLYHKTCFVRIVRLDRFPAVLVGNERLMGSDKRLRNSKY